MSCNSNTDTQAYITEVINHARSWQGDYFQGLKKILKA